jgi:hypothetical protein
MGNRCRRFTTSRVLTGPVRATWRLFRVRPGREPDGRVISLGGVDVQVFRPLRGMDRDAYGYSGDERRRELKVKVKSLERGVFVLLFLGPSDFITRPEAWDVFPRKGHLGLRLP